MKPVKSLRAVLAFAFLTLPAFSQSFAGNLSFEVDGDFSNPGSVSASSVMLTDNDLTNGYASGFDLYDAPTGMSSSGPKGSSAFQWGEAATWTSYAHTSALWFAPNVVNGANPEQTFSLGKLFYRNGTIVSNTGASSVNLQIALNFLNDPQAPLVTNFMLELINTVNVDGDAIGSADIVRLGNMSAPTEFRDSSGNRYYFEMTFRPDQNTLDGTLSTPEEFRVFEGGQGMAELWGRFTTSPASPGANPVPEPSSALLGGLGMMVLVLRRKRRA